MARTASRQHLALEKGTFPSSRGIPRAGDGASDEELLRRLSTGDVAALDAALSRYWTSLVIYIAGVVGSRDMAEDVAQEAFCRLWEKSDQLRADGSLRGFLFQVAHNLAISEQRRTRARSRSLEVIRAEEPSFAEPVDTGADALDASLERAIGELTERRREILLLRSVHGLSYKEIGAALGIAPQTVANQFSTALSLLRRALGKVLLL